MSNLLYKERTMKAAHFHLEVINIAMWVNGPHELAPWVSTNGDYAHVRMMWQGKPAEFSGSMSQVLVDMTSAAKTVKAGAV